MTALPIGHAATPLTDALWERYRRSGDPSARTELLDRYLGLVHHVAREIKRRTPAVELDELVSAGTLGLVRALESFDVSRGLAFSTYAVRRIRGAVLDELRGRDWTPRSVRARSRKLQAVSISLQAKLGRSPDARELAAALGMDLTSYWQWRSGIGANVVIPLDGAATPGHAGGLTIQETLEDPDAPHLAHALREEERTRALRHAIGTLPARERTVLALYYYEEMKLRQIAQVLHVTESRVSQLRSQALRRLKDRVADLWGD